MGSFATSTLIADTAALKSGSGTSDSVFASTEAKLSHLLRARDVLATVIKNQLFRAAFSNAPIFAAELQRALCGALVAGAQRLT